MSCNYESDGTQTVEASETASRLMSQYSWLASYYRCLSETYRVRLLIELRKKPLSISEMAELMGLQEMTISHQMALLRAHHLVDVTREGRRRIYDLTEQGRFLATQAADLMALIS